MSFKDDSKTYMDPEGFFGQRQNPGFRSTNNSLLYTGTYFTILVILGEARKEDLEVFEKIVQACEVPVGAVPTPGLYYRHPDQNDIPEEHDDYVGLASAAYHLNSSVAKDIVNYGRKHAWFYDSITPFAHNLARWHAKFGSVTPHYKVCAGERLPLFDQITWATSILLDAISPRVNLSTKILNWLKIKAIDGKYPICNAAIAFWRFKMHRLFPNGMADVFTLYFTNDGGSEHPFAKATLGVL